MNHPPLPKLSQYLILRTIDNRESAYICVKLLISHYTKTVHADFGC